MTLPTPAPPTVLQEERITQALIMKATRILVMADAPLGTWGEPTEFGLATVRPDYQIRELLYGLHLTVDVTAEDLAALVTVDDVIRNGLQLDPASLPTDRQDDVQRCIDAAADWVATNLEQSWGVG